MSSLFDVGLIKNVFACIL